MARAGATTRGASPRSRARSCAAPAGGGGGARVRTSGGAPARVGGSMGRGAGGGGCGFEPPLAAMRAALGPLAANAGFLRPDAALAVLILADEDDCPVASPTFFAPAPPPPPPRQATG